MITAIKTTSTQHKLLREKRIAVNQIDRAKEKKVGMMALKKKELLSLTGVCRRLTLAQPHRGAIESFNFLDFFTKSFYLWKLLFAFGMGHPQRQRNSIAERNTCRLWMGTKRVTG